MRKEQLHNPVKYKIREWIDTHTWGYLDKFIHKYPKLEKPTVVIFGICCMGISVVGFVIFISALKGIIPLPNNNSKTVLSASVANINKNSENPIEKRVNDEKVDQKCSGAEFDILDDLSDVGGERFSFPNKYDDHIASPAGNLFQGSKKTSWECSLPFVATVSVTPEQSRSIGLFLEFENTFRVIVGDGDKKSIKVEKNDLGDRGPWSQVYRSYLKQDLKDNKELTVTVKAKVVSGLVNMIIQIDQPGEAEPIVISDISSFVPNGILLTPNLSSHFRVGINDSLYKNQGSILRLNSFSVNEEEW